MPLKKVNRKFNEVYTKLFNGGIAKLELVDSDDPLEAGLELLVSPPGKRLQSISFIIWWGASFDSDVFNICSFFN